MTTNAPAKPLEILIVPPLSINAHYTQVGPTTDTVLRFDAASATQ
jgi:hypothetical protein